MLSHFSTCVLKHTSHNSAFKKESYMALCIIISTRMSVVLSIKWSINRSWKGNTMLCYIWKFGFKWFIPVTIMLLWIYHKHKTKQNKKQSVILMSACMHAYDCYLFWLFLICCAKEKTWAVGVGTLSCLCLGRRAW